jgi:hypothetical protein
MYNEIENKIATIYKNCTKEIDTPQKQYKGKKEWISQECIKLIKEKNKLWKKIKSRKFVNKGEVVNYQKLKQKARRLVNNEKQQYYGQVLDDKEKDKKAIWKTINELTGKRQDNIDELLMKNFHGSDLQEVRNNFNKNFVKQALTLKNKYKRKITNDTAMNGRVNDKTLFICPPETNEILKIIREIKSTPALGADGFLLEHFKKTAENSVNFILPLINTILNKEVWPDKLKIQVLRPVFKKGNKKTFDNYRPIALLPAINKIIEKFFAYRIQNFLTKYKIISTKQFGFQKKKGTTEALKFLNDEIAKALNEGKFIGTILIDLQKAFDTINREIILQKLNTVGLRGKILEILKSYLNSRKSYVRIENKLSEQLECPDGVPQGSILGPLLFLIYVNDIGDGNLDRFILFADDIFLYSFETNYELMIANLQKSFNEISGWCVKNEVFINEEKTMMMEIKTPHAQPYNSRNIVLHLNHEFGNCTKECVSLKKTKTAKYLGLELDSSWKSEAHVLKLILKLRQLMPKIYQLRKILGIKNKKILYDAWIESHLRYAIEVYGWANDTNINKLQTIQNKIVKLLFKSSKLNKTNDIFYNMKILKIRQLKEYVVIIKNYFELSNKIATTRADNKLRNTTVTLKTPSWKNNYGKLLTKFYAPNIFNKIPLKLQKLETYGAVKREIKTWLLDMQNSKT